MSLRRLNSVKNLARLDFVKTLTKMVRGLGSSQSKGKHHYISLSVDSQTWPKYLNRKGSDPSNDNEIPEGCLVVYVREERKRFVIPTVYLSHLIFLMMLDKAHEEYGFKKKEDLTVPCTVEIFEESLWLIECSQSTYGQFDLELLVNNLIIKAFIGPHE